MKDSSKRLLGLLGSLALLIASFFILVSFIRPEYAGINLLRGDLASKQDTYESQKKITKAVTDLLDKHESVSGLRDVISRVIPNTEDYATLVNQLSSLARMSGILLESIQLHNTPVKSSAASTPGTTPLPTLKLLQVNLRLVGPYESFKSFLDKVETNIRVMDPTNIVVTPSGSGSTYAYDVVVNTYYQPL